MTKAAALGLLKQTPAALLLTEQILRDFGHKVVQEAEQVRHLITNKLVIETENPDPRVRLRALELLGKIGDVGLFNEKREVTITHQTVDDVKIRLREKLQALLLVQDAEIVEYDDDE
jgi:HEAT repeat protein